MAGIEVEVGIARGADDGRAVGRHRAQASPEGGSGEVAAGEQVAGDHFQRFAPTRVEPQIESAQLRHAAHADAMIEAGEGDFVGFVQHGGTRCERFVGQRHGERVTLDRIDRQIEAQRRQKVTGVTAQRQHIAIRGEDGVSHLHAGDALTIARQSADRLAELEFHAQFACHLAQAGGEHLAIAGFVVRQAQAADKPVAGVRQTGLDLGELVAVEQFVGHAAFFEHGHVALHRIELRLAAKHLQRAAGALLVGDAGFGAQRLQAGAAVLGQTHHALFIHRIAFSAAVAQHLRHPAQLPQRAVWANRQRRMALKHPLHRLERNTGRCPGRGVARRYLAGIGEAGFHCAGVLAVDHRHLRAGLGEVVRRGGSDHAGAENNDFHGKHLFNN